MRAIYCQDETADTAKAKPRSFFFLPTDGKTTVPHARKSRAILQGSLAGFVLLLALPGGDANAQAPLNTGVLQYAQKNLGQRVGNGQCSALASAALASVGAKTTDDFGVVGPDGNYVWGTPVARLADVRPGDILQFRNVKITNTTIQRTSRGVFSYTSSYSYPHHTAIVASNDGKGKLTTLEQNSNNRLYVTQGQLDFSGSVSGKIWAYRPVKK